MSIYQHYLETATGLIENYKAEIPFHQYLKQFFANRRKYGSRDRKIISSLCYSFFRLGHALMKMPVSERMIVARFLDSSIPSKFLEAIDPSLNEKSSLDFDSKTKFVSTDFHISQIFPFGELLSVGLDTVDYCASMIQKPDLFLRVRPNYAKAVGIKLSSLGWKFMRESESCYRVESGLPVDQYFALNRELVIQDMNSQKVGEVIKQVFDKYQFNPKQMWDCCAASGGKSIMMSDIFSVIELTVSDIRQSILKNLERRFKEAGVRKKQQFVVDLTISELNIPIKPFDFIFADVPCSGSGTWSRTPEQLYYFKKNSIEEYALKQKSIVLNALKYLNENGWLAYVTCSVFKKENENMVELLVAEYHLELVHAELLNGTNQKADSMFIAIFIKRA